MIYGIHTSRQSPIDEDTPLPIEQAILRDSLLYNTNAVQIFTHGPKNLRRNNIDCEGIVSCNMNISVHSPYMLQGIWNADGPARLKYLQALGDCLEVCDAIKSTGLVVHIHSVEPTLASRIMAEMLQVAKSYNTPILLEMTAVKSSDITYDLPDKINHLTNLVGDSLPWGWVVDTAHIWGAGYDCRTKHAMNKWLSGITSNIRMFHLNGSSSAIGSGQDKHEIIFSAKDKIFHATEPKKSGVYAVVKYAIKHNIPIIMEINRGIPKDANDAMNILRLLAKQST